MTQSANSEVTGLGPNGTASASLLPVWIGPVVAFVGLVSYPLFFVNFPTLRDFPWVNLPVVLLGLLLSTVGLRAAFHRTRTWLAKLIGSFCFLASLALTALLCVYVFFLSYQLPESADVPEAHTAAPDFSLPDQEGRTTHLADFRGQRVVISFYRGHW